MAVNKISLNKLQLRGTQFQDVYINKREAGDSSNQRLIKKTCRVIKIFDWNSNGWSFKKMSLHTAATEVLCYVIHNTLIRIKNWIITYIFKKWQTHWSKYTTQIRNMFLIIIYRNTNYSIFGTNKFGKTEPYSINTTMVLPLYMFHTEGMSDF
jgi:hypothetical protein